MALNQEPIPYNDDLTKDNQITDEWSRWLTQTLLPQVQNAPTRVENYTTGLAGSNASGPLTPLGSVQIAGQFRYNHYLQILSPDGGGSGAQVTLTWTFGGIVQQQVFAANNGDLTTTHEGITYVIHVDAGTPVSIAVAYTSTTPGLMAYYYAAQLELLQAD